MIHIYTYKCWNFILGSSPLIKNYRMYLFYQDPSQIWFKLWSLFKKKKMARTSLLVQWIFYMLRSATKKWKIKKKTTLNLAVSIVNFKTSYFPAAWTSSQTGCKRPTKMARCTSVKAGPATSCFLRLPSLWPPGTQSGRWDPPSPFALCSHRTAGKALTLRSIRPFSPSPARLLHWAHCLAELSPCGLLMWLSLWV